MEASWMRRMTGIRKHKKKMAHTHTHRERERDRHTHTQKRRNNKEYVNVLALLCIATVNVRE